jgi:acetyltransferase-like isoleucine patch superfamily enzyme
MRKGPVQNIIRGVRRKVAKGAAKRLPLNAARVRALRAAGYAVGSDVYVGGELHVTDELFKPQATLIIGDRVAIAQRVTIVLSSYANHSVLRQRLGEVHADVVIHEDAWIGACAVLLPGVTIGARAVVGAGAIVTRDVPPDTIVVGNPARPLPSPGSQCSS